MLRRHFKPLLLLLGAFLAARILFILFMPHTYSTDLHSWLRVMNVLEEGGNPYGRTQVLNWPPFWMQMIFAIHQVSKRTGIAPELIVQSVLIVCEAVVIGIVYLIGQRFFNGGKQLFYGLLFGLAINPVSIFLSCQHCNYDVFVGLWVLLAVWMLMEFFKNGEREAWLAACFFIGMGILAKTVPVILTPLLLAGIKTLPWRTRIFGAMLLTAPFTIGMSVLFTLEPHGVMQNVVGYRSLNGWYGFTGLMNLLFPGDLMDIYQRLSPALFVGLILFAAWKCFRRRYLSPVQVINSALLLMLFIPTFGPGYSPPYILWFLPLIILFYVAVPYGLKRFLFLGWVIVALTYIVEYAFFDSHGAFLLQWFPSAEMQALSKKLGDRQTTQTIIRLPMFIFFLAFFLILVKRIKSTDLNARQASPISVL